MADDANILQRLPGEVLVEVLSKLPSGDLVRASAACKTFHDIAQSPHLDERCAAAACTRRCARQKGRVVLRATATQPVRRHDRLPCALRGHSGSSTCALAYWTARRGAAAIVAAQCQHTCDAATTGAWHDYSLAVRYRSVYSECFGSPGQGRALPSSKPLCACTGSGATSSPATVSPPSSRCRSCKAARSCSAQSRGARC